MNQLSKYLLLSIAICAVASCGSDAEQPQIPRVLVNAGQNIQVNEQVTVNIDGIATSTAGGITYAWSSVPTIIFEQADASAEVAASTVIAPSVSQITDYVLTLTATDSNGTTGIDSITMSVNPVNVFPTAVILAPRIDLYGIDSYPILTNVTLDGSLSSDIDPQTSNAPISGYLWQQIAGPDVLAGGMLTSAKLIFKTPILVQPTDITIRLQVTDQEGAISSVDKILRLLSESETIPKLSIGPAQMVFSGELLSLSGQASSTASDAEPFLALWSSDSLLAPIIGDANSMKTFSIAPLVYQQTEITYQLSITDSYGNQRTEMQTMLVEPQTQTPLNDTGVSLNASNNDNLVAYQGAFAGQDSHSGYDRMASSGFSDKAGRGELGFDFTRLNQNGDEVDQNTIDWSCVRDNITGLIWENKTNVTLDLHSVEQIFTWYSLAKNGGFAGDLNSGSSACNLSSGNCNTQAFVDAVNAQGLCGFFDWRLPSHNELLSLVHFGKLQPPLIESEYFPDTGATSPGSPLWYWTFMPNVDGVNESGSQSAWAIDFKSGVDNFINKSTQARIKLVRAGR
jgi:chitinase